MWPAAAPKVTVGLHTHLYLCPASKLAEAFWKPLSFDSWMSWMSPKVPCVNKLFFSRVASLDMIEPATHLSTRGGRGSVEAGGSGIHWQVSGQAGPHKTLSQRCKQKVVGPGERTAGNWGVCLWWNCGTPASFHCIFLGPETAVWFHRLLPHNVLTYHVPQWRSSTKWDQSVMD